MTHKTDVKMTCGHKFCKGCISKCMEKNNKCPYCRQETDFPAGEEPYQHVFLYLRENSNNCQASLAMVKELKEYEVELEEHYQFCPHYIHYYLPTKKFTQRIRANFRQFHVVKRD